VEAAELVELVAAVWLAAVAAAECKKPS